MHAKHWNRIDQLVKKKERKNKFPIGINEKLNLREKTQKYPKFAKESKREAEMNEKTSINMNRKYATIEAAKVTLTFWEKEAQCKQQLLISNERKSNLWALAVWAVWPSWQRLSL